MRRPHPQPQPPRQGTVSTIAVAAFVTSVGMVGPFLLSAQGVWISQDLGFAEASLGTAVSAFFAAAAVSAMALARTSGAWLGRRGYQIGGVLISLGAAGVGLLAQRAWHVAVAMVVIGVGNAVCQVTANLLLARALVVHRRGLGFGVKQSSGPIALAAAGLVIPSVGATLGWRASFLGLAAGSLILSFALQRLATAPSPGPPGRTDTASPSDRPPFAPVLLCAGAMVLGSAAGNFFVAFSPSWLHVQGLSVEVAGLLVGAGGILCCVVRVLLGLVADRRHGGNLSVVAGQFVLASVLLGAVAVLAGAPLAAVIAVAFAVGWSWPGLLLYAIVRVSRETPGMGSGAVQAGAFTGGALGPMLLGWVVSTAGYATAWSIASGLFVLGAVFIGLGQRGFRRDLRTRPPSAPLGYGGGWSAPRMTAGDRPPAPSSGAS